MTGGRAGVTQSVFGKVLISFPSSGRPLNKARKCTRSIFIFARHIGVVWSHFQQQLCKPLILWYFLRLNSPFGNSYICPNTENIFAFDTEENPIWDLNVKRRKMIHSPASRFICCFVFLLSPPAQWQCTLPWLPPEKFPEQALLCCHKHKGWGIGWKCKLGSSFQNTTEQLVVLSGPVL